MVVSPLSCLTQCARQSSLQSSSSLSSPLLGQRSRTAMRDKSETISCFSASSYSDSQAMVSHPSLGGSSSVKDSKMANIPAPVRKINDKDEKMMMMKCQRLREDKTCEEIEICVPVRIFKRMVMDDVGDDVGCNDHHFHHHIGSLGLVRSGTFLLSDQKTFNIT